MAVKTPMLEHILAEVQELSALDQVRLMERLFGILERSIDVTSKPETEEAKAKRLEAWRARLKRTYGALADDPIERPPQ